MTDNNLAARTSSLEIEIVELDDRLDMALDPLLSGVVTINGQCNTNQGCNTVAGCGGKKSAAS